MITRRQPSTFRLLGWAAVLALAIPARALVAAGSPSESFQLQHWTTAHGLPSNTIRSLTQSRDGYLWIGTKNGLARFDGVRFKVFKDEIRIKGRADLSCNDLAEDTSGRIWARLSAGLVCYDHGLFRKYPNESLPFNSVHVTMTASSQGGVWLGTARDGLNLVDGSRCLRTWKTTNGLAYPQPGLLREDNQGRLWIGAGMPLGNIVGWQRWDPATEKFQSLAEAIGQPISAVTDILPGRKGHDIWISTTDGLSRFKDGTLTPLAAKEIIQKGAGAGPWTDDDAGGLWFAPGLAEKLVHFQNGGFQELGIADGLADTDIRSLLWDREGNLWIGYGAGGLQQLRPKGLTSVLATNAAGARQQVDSIALAPDGAVWLGTWTQLLRWDGSSTRSFMTPVPQRHDTRPVFITRDHQVWLGSLNHGLFTLENDKIVAVPAADDGRPLGWSVRTIFEDRRGRLWIGSDSGLLQKRGRDFVRYTRRDGMADDDILGLQEAPDGTLWVGTIKGGLQQFRDDKFHSITAQDGLLSNAASPLLVEADGTLWAGTSAGLNRISPDGKIGAVTEREGLFANEVFCLLDDSAGYFWGNSVHGIFRARKSDLHAVASGRKEPLACVGYGEADGVTSAEGSGEFQPNACRTPDGRMWFSTIRGAAVLDPPRLIEREVPPLVVIEQVLADRTIIYSDGAILSGQVLSNNPAQVHLRPGQARGLEIRYTANSFIAPDKVRFRYRLHGVDPDWREADNRRQAFYTDLRPRAYRFEVEASTQEGIWSPQPAVFAFSIAPAFTQTAWFPALCAFALLSGSAGIGFWRLRWQRRVLLAEQNASLERERSRIARDLHDDLGTALTGLALELDVVRKKIDATPRASCQLESTAGRTRELAERMREVVWAVNPRCDTVSSLASFLEQQTAQFLGSDGIRGRLDFPEDIPPLPMDSDARHQLALAVREALANVVRHAHATEVNVSLLLDPGFLVVRVQDNGIGRKVASPARGQNGSGLLNMSDRLERVGGSFEFISNQTGTTVTFRVPIGAAGERGRPS